MQDDTNDPINTEKLNNKTALTNVEGGPSPEGMQPRRNEQMGGGADRPPLNENNPANLEAAQQRDQNFVKRALGNIRARILTARSDAALRRDGIHDSKFVPETPWVTNSPPAEPKKEPKSWDLNALLEDKQASAQTAEIPKTPLDAFFEQQGEVRSSSGRTYSPEDIKALTAGVLSGELQANVLPRAAGIRATVLAQVEENKRNGR